MKKPKIGSLKVPQVDLYFQKESKWKNANKKGIELCNKGEERICAKTGKYISAVKRKEGKDIWVHRRTTEERVY